MRSFTIVPDEILSWKGLKYRVSRVIDLEHVLAVNLHTGDLDRIRISELKPEYPESEQKNELDLTSIKAEEWQAANDKYAVIKPLIDKGSQRTKKDVLEAAKLSGKSVATLYRWIQDYEGNGTLSSLVRRIRNDQGESRLTPELDQLIIHSIDEHYLKIERPSPTKAYKDFRNLCRRSKVEPCSKATYIRRTEQIAPREQALRRQGPKFTRETFDAATESFPYGRFPLDAVQIDHTQPNVIIVDDIERQSIGRPWVTFAIDIYSRTILGFLLALEAPSANSVALCMTHAICRKEVWLRNRGIDTSWPIWGKMRALFADNGPDFRCKALDMACQEHSITINWRPLGKPEYGGHIERLMRTVKSDLSDLKGTTFRNPVDRGEYDSEGRAIFSFSEFEQWLTVYITKYYHQKKHSALDTSPIKKLEQGILYGDDMPPIGLPSVVENEHRFYVDFLPFVKRTVQRYGIEIDNIKYFHPSISRWIGVRSNSEDGKFTIKYERHQIGFVYFFDPESKEYLEIPRVRRDAPQTTRFQLKQVQASLKQKGRPKRAESDRRKS